MTPEASVPRLVSFKTSKNFLGIAKVDVDVSFPSYFMAQLGGWDTASVATRRRTPEPLERQAPKPKAAATEEVFA